MQKPYDKTNHFFQNRGGGPQATPINLIHMQANKYFQVKELVSSKIYNQYGDDAIKFLDPKALEALENVREILNAPLICNN